MYELHFLQIPSKKGHKTVCSKFLLSMFNLSRARVIRLAKLIANGDLPRELRGGDRVSNKLLTSKDEVREFLGELKGSESHYNRQKSKRIYLNSNLTIKKLYKHYQSSAKLKVVSFSTFHRIFSNEFNIGFNSPAADVCSLCERLKNSIAREKNPQKKLTLQTEKRIHKLRANAFYKLMKEKPANSVTFSFDLQQVQPLPKTAVSDAFYLRQISYYTFGVVGLDSRNPIFYSWTEDQAGRGSIEVASALLNFLQNLELAPDITTIRLFCDGCGGQNKNSHLIHMLIYWLANTATSVTSVTITFPVRGHSFLPADRAFARVEKLLRKEAFIKNKEKYHEIYEEVGCLQLLGEDWKLWDIKGLQAHFKKLVGISEMKRIILEKRNLKGNAQVVLRGLKNYRFESEFEDPQNLCKRGTKLTTISLRELKMGHDIPLAKLQNLESLLKAEYNNNWASDPDLKWYTTLLPSSATNKEEVQGISSECGGEEEESCTCLDEEPGYHI